MSIHDATKSEGALVLVTEQSGVTVIPQPTPLTRLNYFDGKFLRASDLSIEQLYLRRLMDLSNQAGGAGVAYGYSLSLASGGDRLDLCQGLAIDPQGRVLLLPQPFSIDVQELIDRSRQVKSPSTAPGANGSFAECRVVTETLPDGVVVQGGELYLIVIGFAEALCGQEDVFGKLCEEACVTSTDRPFLVEGLVLRAVPLQLQTALPTSAVVALSQVHLRSRVASSYFEDERRRVASFISGEGLRSEVWCLGAETAGGRDVPIGVLARAGSTTVFLDVWTARRERIDPPARRYWQWRMAMRPWDVFLAQVLQFQCQLSDLFRRQPPEGGGDDPCAGAHGVIREASAAVARLASFYETVTTRFTMQPLLVDGTASTEKPPVLEGGLAGLLDFQKRLQAADAASSIPSTKILVDGGIVAVPSAGYLPVTPHSVVTVNEQVRRLLGRGVDLRFCIVRPDFVAHALEEAQHMERISLLEGLDRPDRKPEVDILVPDGESVAPKPATGVAYETELRVGDSPRTAAALSTASLSADNRPVLRGAAHIDVPDSGNVQLFTSVHLDQPAPPAGTPPVLTDQPSAVVARAQLTSLWGTVTCSLNPFTAQSGGQALLEIRVVPAISATVVQDVLMNGTLAFDQPAVAGTKRAVKGTFSGTLSVVSRSSGQTQESNSRLTLEVTAVLDTPEGQAPSLRVTFFNRPIKLAVEVSASWSGSPRTISFGLKQTSTSFDPTGLASAVQQTLLDALFTQNDDVLLPTNARHAAALNALDTLGAALGDAQFPPKSAALLFPPPPPPADDLQVRAVLDWVLFHRRRTKRCQPEIISPVLPVRRYQLWHGLVANQDALKKTVEALHSKAAFDPQAVAFQVVDVIEFAPGIPTLLSPKDAVQEDWKRVKPGQQLLYGGIASRDAAKQDGPELAKGRLGEVEQAVAEISKPGEAVLLEVLDEIHPDLAVPDVDGIVVALTIRQTTCVTVFGVRDENQMNQARDAVAAGDFVKAFATGSIVGHVQFASGTDDVVNDSLVAVVEEWKKRGLLGTSNIAFVAVRAGDSTVPPAVAVSQGRAIQLALGTGPVPEPKTSPAALPDCPVILFIAQHSVFL